MRRNEILKSFHLNLNKPNKEDSTLQKPTKLHSITKESFLSKLMKPKDSIPIPVKIGAGSFDARHVTNES